jgi:hypothetical protein
MAKTGGRQVGTPNKADKLRQMILRALDGVGGQQYLQRQAELNPGPFLSLVSKCLPREVHQEITAEMTVRAEVRRELVESMVMLLRTEAGETQRVDRPRLASQRNEAPAMDGRERGVLDAEEAREGPPVVEAGSEAVVRTGARSVTVGRDAGSVEGERGGRDVGREGERGGSEEGRGVPAGAAAPVHPSALPVPARIVGFT